MNGGLTYEGQTRLSLNSAICWKGSSDCKNFSCLNRGFRKLHTQTFLKEIDSGKPISTTEQYNSEHYRQERLDKLVQNENYKFWLGGFIEGEGSLLVSLVINNKLTHGLALQPEFNIVQHVSGIDILKVLFKNKGYVHKNPVLKMFEYIQ